MTQNKKFTDATLKKTGNKLKFKYVAEMSVHATCYLLPAT